MISAIVSFFLDTDEIMRILNGIVEAISRTKPLGGLLDTFRIEGCTFFFRSISALDLSEIVRIMFSQYGYGSPEEFAEDLRSADEDVTDQTTVYTHHISECGCYNCSITDCERSGLCPHWRGWTP